jgi:hypothetical protein
MDYSIRTSSGFRDRRQAMIAVEAVPLIEPPASGRSLTGVGASFEMCEESKGAA